MPMEFYCYCVPAAKANPERKNALVVHIQNLNDEALEELEEYYTDMQDIDRDDLVERAEEYWNLDEKSEVETITLPGSAPHFFSGGMSFGDSPTESFDLMLFLCRVDGVYKLLEKWAREDQAVEKQVKNHG